MSGEPITATEIRFRLDELERSPAMKELDRSLQKLVNEVTEELFTTPIQFRFPRSKKKRIRKKWRKDPRNFRKLNSVAWYGVVDTGLLWDPNQLVKISPRDWMRLHVPPKKVRLYNRTHACDSDGYPIPNFEEFYPPRIKYLQETSYERYKKTEDGKYFDSIALTGEVGKVESIRFIETGGQS